MGIKEKSIDNEIENVTENNGETENISQDYNPGDNKKKTLYKKIIISGIFILLFISVCFLTLGVYTYINKVCYITVSMDSSVSMTVNSFGKVINLVGLNSKGMEVVSSLSYKHKGIEEVLARIYIKSFSLDYVDKTGNVDVKISGADYNQLKKVKETLNITSMQIFSEHGITAVLNIVTVDTADQYKPVFDETNEGEKNNSGLFPQETDIFLPTPSAPEKDELDIINNSSPEPVPTAQIYEIKN